MVICYGEKKGKMMDYHIHMKGLSEKCISNLNPGDVTDVFSGWL